MRVRADTNRRRGPCRFEPGNFLELQLKRQEDGRRRLDRNATGVADGANGAALAMRMRRRRILLVGRGRHVGTDRSRVERIGRGVSDNAKRRDRRKQLHQHHQQDDWNKTLQPPTHRILRSTSPCPNIGTGGCRDQEGHSSKPSCAGRTRHPVEPIKANTLPRNNSIQSGFTRFTFCAESWRAPGVAPDLCHCGKIDPTGKSPNSKQRLCPAPL